MKGSLHGAALARDAACRFAAVALNHRRLGKGDTAPPLTFPTKSGGL